MSAKQEKNINRFSKISTNPMLPTKSAHKIVNKIELKFELTADYQNRLFAWGRSFHRHPIS